MPYRFDSCGIQGNTTSSDSPPSNLASGPGPTLIPVSSMFPTGISATRLFGPILSGSSSDLAGSILPSVVSELSVRIYFLDSDCSFSSGARSYRHPSSWVIPSVSLSLFSCRWVPSPSFRYLFWPYCKHAYRNLFRCWSHPAASEDWWFHLPNTQSPQQAWVI